ncbi:MAG: hypothetical protein ACI8QW_001548, partial [Saprospiraceae bacterium]
TVICLGCQSSLKSLPRSLFHGLEKNARLESEL